MKEIELMDCEVGDTIIIDKGINQHIREGMRFRVLETDLEYHDDDGSEVEVLCFRITEKDEKGVASWLDDSDYDRVTCFCEVIVKHE